MVSLQQVAVAGKESCHGADLEAILLQGDAVYTAADDGKVKVWNKDLVLQKEIQAHDYAVYHLMIHKNRLFTASVDSTIKVWKLPSLELETTLTGHEDAVKRVVTNGKQLFSGDDKGIVIAWNIDSLASQNKYEVMEEVWDLAARDQCFFTVRDRGLSIIEVKEDDTSMYTVVKSLQGRAPIYLSEQYLVYTQFGSEFGLNLHKYQPIDFPKIADIKGHEMIITCLSGAVVSGGSERIASGGYDNKINMWELPSGQLLASCSTAVTPSALAVATDGSVYVGGPDGYLVKMMTS